MKNTMCYKCSRTPDDDCGDCPAWCEHQIATPKERDAFKAGIDEILSFAYIMRNNFNWYDLDKIAKRLKCEKICNVAGFNEELECPSAENCDECPYYY